MINLYNQDCMVAMASMKTGEFENMNNQAVVLYDGACPVCSREIAHYRRRKGSERINWVDIRTDAKSLEPPLRGCCDRPPAAEPGAAADQPAGCIGSISRQGPRRTLAYRNQCVRIFMVTNQTVPIPGHHRHQTQTYPLARLGL